MTEKEDIAVLVDWKIDHAEEHKTIWKKIDENATQHTDFIRAIERLETKLAIYAGVAALIGTFAGSLMVDYLKP